MTEPENAVNRKDDGKPSERIEARSMEIYVDLLAAAQAAIAAPAGRTLTDAEWTEFLASPHGTKVNGFAAAQASTDAVIEYLDAEAARRAEWEAKIEAALTLATRGEPRTLTLQPESD